MLINILTAATLAAAINIPPSALLATEPKNHVKLASNSCTFTLWHRQQSSIDYVQLNTIFDRANNLRVDVAAHRPATGFNNYVRLDDAHVFAVTGLLDDRNLTISHVPQDGLRFEIGEVWWSTQRSGEEAGCNAWEWEGVLDRRVCDSV